MSYHACLFEAKSIQSYLFSSGRMPDVIGASELLDSLTGPLLDAALSALRLVEGTDILFSRRAGGAFHAYADEASITQFHALWTLLVQQYAPGLAYDIALGEGATALDAFDAARQALRADTSRHRPRLPAAAPIVDRHRRTGQAVEFIDDHDGRIDAATARKKAFVRRGSSGFIERFSPPNAALGRDDWPRDLTPGGRDAFPYLGDDHTVALIHADGNGLGQLLMNVRTAASNAPARFIGLFRTLSEGITQCTVEAARTATAQVLVPVRQVHKPLAARPILLGGDDLTILVRADLAMDFLRAFIEAFEAQSQKVLKDLTDQGVGDLPERLTVGAGLVYLRHSQPFYLASRLAESLMAQAKRRAKQFDPACPPSSMAFHRVTASLIDDAEAIVTNERSHRDGDITYVDTLGCYFLGHGTHGPRLDDLIALRDLLSGDDMARGPTRQLLTLIGQAPAQARQRYRRWRQLMKDQRKARLDEFDQHLKTLLDTEPDSTLPYAGQGSTRATPLGDALALLGAGSTPQQETEQESAA